MARTIAEAFNEWMKRYTERPEEYNREFQSVIEFLEESKAGEIPTYGDRSAAYLQKLIDEV